MADESESVGFGLTYSLYLLPFYFLLFTFYLNVEPSTEGGSILARRGDDNAEAAAAMPAVQSRGLRGPDRRRGMICSKPANMAYKQMGL